MKTARPENGNMLKLELNEFLEDIKDCYGNDLRRTFKNAYYASNDLTFGERCNVLNKLVSIFYNSADEAIMRETLKKEFGAE